MLRSCRVLVLLVLVAIMLVTVLAGSASAAGWLAPARTQPGTYEVDSEDIELDAQGNATAAWVEYQPWRAVRAATRPRGGVWSQPVTLSDPTEEGAWQPQVAVGANGDAVVVWSSNYRPPAETQTVLAVTREAGGQWSQPVEISKPASQGGFEVAGEPEVVLDAQGDATAIWSEETSRAAAIVASTRPRGGAWSAPVELTNNEENAGRFPELAVDSAGDVTAIWTWGPGEYLGGVVQSATRPVGGAWSAPVNLSNPVGKALFPQVAVDPQGDAVAVWRSGTGGGHVQAARRTANGAWDPMVDLSEGEAYDPDVAIDPQGNATAVWETHDEVGNLVHASTSALGSAWSAPVDLSERDEDEGIGASPQVVVDSTGTVTAAWRTYHDFGINMIQSARRELGGQWSQPVNVGRSNGAIEDFPLAVDPAGYVTAGWSRGASIYSAVFDSVSPELNAVEVPATGVVGQRVAMSVDPFDVWPPVATRWDFGDGGAAPGAVVSHCYSMPGEYTVTVTGTDGAANTTSSTQTISIEPNVALANVADPCAPPEPPKEPVPPKEPSPPKDSPPGEPTPPPKLAPVQPGPPGTGGYADPGLGTGPPVLFDLRESNSRWRTRTSRSGSRSAVGTTFMFKLDRAAQVRFVFSRIASGRWEGARCVRATRANVKQPRCDLYQARGTLQTAGKAGVNVLSFAGKIGKSTLGPGRYRLLVTAVAGGDTSTPASIGFTIAR